MSLTTTVNSYFEKVLELDPDAIWLDLCRNRRLAKDRCRVFLRRFVTDLVQRVPTLGPEEYQLKRIVNSANTLLNVRRCLIAQADSTVLLAKRQEDPSNEDTWRLKFLDHTNRQGYGPIFEISKVGLPRSLYLQPAPRLPPHLRSFPLAPLRRLSFLTSQRVVDFGAGATELKLCTELTVEKIEAAAEDVINIAYTVWERADAVPRAPEIRVVFLAMLLLAGIGGFRPKALLHFPFKQIRLVIVRDPQDRSSTKIAVTFRVPIIKKRRSSRGTQPKWCVVLAYLLVRLYLMLIIRLQDNFHRDLCPRAEYLPRKSRHVSCH